MKSLPLLMALCVAGAAAAFGTAEPPKAAPEPARVADLIRQLGDDDFDKREAATKILRAIGKPVLPALYKAAMKDEDVEVRYRAQAIIDAAKAPETAAVRAILGHGGEVRRDEADPLRPVVAVDLKDKQVPDRVLTHLEALDGLRELALYGVKVTDDDLLHLKGLTALTRLRLGSPLVTDAGVAHLKGLKNLGFLQLACPLVTDAGVAHLKGLKNLGTLYLECPRVTDAGLAHLKGLDKLGVLSLAQTKVTDAGLIHIKGLKGLRLLCLYQTSVTDAGLTHLKGLDQLTRLIVLETKVTDKGFADLRKALPNLSRD